MFLDRKDLYTFASYLKKINESLAVTARWRTDAKLELEFARSEPGPPMTLGGAAAAHVRFIVWCKQCHHQVEPDPGEMARRYGPETTVLDWHKRLVCSRCGSHDTDMVATGERR